MSDRTIIVAPTFAEAQAEANSLGRAAMAVILVSNGTSGRLRGLTFSETDLIRVREDAWTDELFDMVKASLATSQVDA